MKCSAFIATSIDGYIATSDGGIDWLDTAGNSQAEMGVDADMGFEDFIRSVDCMVMGRKCMDVISAMNLTPEQWPYGNIPIVVLSRSVGEPPENLSGRVEMYSGELPVLIRELEDRGLKHAYIDGGTTITCFLNHQLLNEIIVTKVPILLGAGIPLFGKIDTPIRLQQARAIAFPNDFIQIKYHVNYEGLQ